MEFLRKIILLVALSFAARAAEVHVAIVRFNPTDKTTLLRPLELTLGKVAPSQLLAAFQKHGDAAIIFEAREKIGAEGRVIERDEKNKVVLPGGSEELPAITRLAVKLNIKATGPALYWNGAVRWSPQVIDAAARKPTDPLIRAFAPLGQKTGAFEYPILKENSFDGSKLARVGEVIFSATAAEAGGRAPELVVLCLWISSL